MFEIKYNELCILDFLGNQEVSFWSLDKLFRIVFYSLFSWMKHNK